MSAARHTISLAAETKVGQLEADANAAATGMEKLSELMTRAARGDLDADENNHVRRLMARLVDALPELQQAHLAIEEAKRLRELPN